MVILLRNLQVRGRSPGCVTVIVNYNTANIVKCFFAIPTFVNLVRVTGASISTLDRLAQVKRPAHSFAAANLEWTSAVSSGRGDVMAALDQWQLRLVHTGATDLPYPKVADGVWAGMA
jgi:hypothetical protein